MAKQKYDKVWKLLQGKGWCQGAFARNKLGEAALIRGKDACSFCAAGALTRVYGSPKKLDSIEMRVHHARWDRLTGAIQATTPYKTVVGWNDAKKTTKAQVVRMFKRLDI